MRVSGHADIIPVHPHFVEFCRLLHLEHATSKASSYHQLDGTHMNVIYLTINDAFCATGRAVFSLLSRCMLHDT